MILLVPITVWATRRPRSYLESEEKGRKTSANQINAARYVLQKEKKYFYIVRLANKFSKYTYKTSLEMSLQTKKNYLGYTAEPPKIRDFNHFESTDICLCGNIVISTFHYVLESRICRHLARSAVCSII